MTADEIIEGVKEFCRTHTYVNDKKVGCIGASYGGFMTQYLLTKTDIFAAAVSHAGISSVSSYWGEGYWGYSYMQWPPQSLILGQIMSCLIEVLFSTPIRFIRRFC